MKPNVFELLREQIMKSPFVKHMGISVCDVGPGYARVEA